MAEREGFGYPRFPQVTLKLTDSDNSLYSCGFQAHCFSGSYFSPRVVVSIVSPKKVSVVSPDLTGERKVRQELTGSTSCNVTQCHRISPERGRLCRRAAKPVTTVEGPH